jgi:uncharacterized membrane protein YfcA
MDGNLLIAVVILIGFAAGTLSGLVGIGGGVVMVPALVLLGFAQHKAQGTSLALLTIPVGILGVMNYYKSGNVDIRTALLMGAGFVLGSFLGSKFAIGLDKGTLQKIFGVFCLVYGLKLLLGK